MAAQADAMKEAFVHNVDALVTRDYLDTRFSAFETRVEANMDKRFTGMEKQFAALDSSVDKRFAEQDAKFDARFSAIDLKLAKIDEQFRLIYWMLAVIIASTVIPAIQHIYSQL